MGHWMSNVPLVAMHKMARVTEAEDALLFGRQITEKCSVESQGGIAIVRNILGLERYRRIVVTIEQCVPDLENRVRLTMDSRRVEYNHCAGGAVHIYSLTPRGVCALLARVQARSQLLMRAFHVSEPARIDVGEI